MMLDAEDAQAGTRPHELACRMETDIAYGAAPEQLLDLYLPRRAEPAGLILFMHGGGWVRGDKAGGRGFGRALAACGYAVASAGYRKVPQTTVAGQAGDVAAAAALLLAGAGGRIRPQTSLALAGHSSGAHLAALVAIDPRFLEAERVSPGVVAGVLAFDGVFDIGAMAVHHPRTAPPEVFGTTQAGWDEVSPQALLPRLLGNPLFGIMHEDTNRRFVEQAAPFCDALRGAGRRWMRGIAPGLDHGDIMKLFNEPGQPMPVFAQAFAALAFNEAGA